MLGDDLPGARVESTGVMTRQFYVPAGMSCWYLALWIQVDALNALMVQFGG